MGEMRGHTNNRILASALASVTRRALFDLERITDAPQDAEYREYQQGKIDAANELAILLYVNDEYDRIVEQGKRERQERLAAGA